MGEGRFNSDRVGLRALEETDTEALHAYLNHPALLGRRYLPGDVPDLTPLSRAQVAEILEGCAKPKNAFTLGIELRDTGELVGHAGCNWNWDTHCPSVSIAVAPTHQRAGIGSEALRMLLGHLFEDTTAHNVNGWVPGWSEPALAFAKRHGFTECGRVPRAGLRDGVWFEDVMLDILRPEWVAAREGSHGARR
ncbi:MAG: GNAT family protein [Planctomycetota bacterium]